MNFWNFWNGFATAQVIIFPCFQVGLTRVTVSSLFTVSRAFGWSGPSDTGLAAGCGPQWSGLVMRPFARSRTFCNSLSASCNWNSQKRIIKSFNDLETMIIYFTLLWASFEPGQKTLSRKFSVFGFLSLAPFYFVSSVVNFHYQKLKSQREAK